MTSVVSGVSFGVGAGDGRSSDGGVIMTGSGGESASGVVSGSGSAIVGSSGDTALSEMERCLVTAAEEGDAELAADLLTRGANVNAEHYNKTLFYASQVCGKKKKKKRGRCPKGRRRRRRRGGRRRRKKRRREEEE